MNKRIDNALGVAEFFIGLFLALSVIIFMFVPVAWLWNQWVAYWGM